MADDIEQVTEFSVESSVAREVVRPGKAERQAVAYARHVIESADPEKVIEVTLQQ